MSKTLRSFLVGFGIPAVAVLIVAPILGQTSLRIGSIPILYGWMTIWLPLTTLCLWLSWKLSGYSTGEDDRP